MRKPRDAAAFLLMGTAGSILFAVALAVRLGERHAGLLYPDGYQYLLMARGIGEHLRPITELGPHGELFVPSVDAAAKPLYPALVAVADVFGADPRAAAGFVTALAAAAAVVLAAALGLRLSGSLAGAAAAGGFVLASPALAYWSGFAGPEPLAEALALATALAVVSRRASAAGVLCALLVAARPEYLVLAVAAALAAAYSRELRRPAGCAALAFVMTLSALLAVVRPPLALPAEAAVLAAAVVGATLALLVAAAAGRSRTAALTLAVCGLAAVGALGGRAPAVAAIWHSEWPLLCLAGAGFLAACAGRHRREALFLGVCVCVLGAIYVAKNPGSERYLSQLLPLAAVAVALGIAALPRRVPGVALAGLALVLVTSPSRSSGVDPFPMLAAELRSETGADREVLVSATPDAYGVLLPDVSQRSLRPGAHGLVLLDAAQRLYEPEVAVRGLVVARFEGAPPLARPDGTFDFAPAVLVRGSVLDTGGTASTTPGESLVERRAPEQ